MHHYGPRKTLYDRFVRQAAKAVGNDVFHARQKGEHNQAIGRWRGRRTTKIDARRLKVR